MSNWLCSIELYVVENVVTYHEFKGLYVRIRIYLMNAWIFNTQSKMNYHINDLTIHHSSEEALVGLHINTNWTCWICDCPSIVDNFQVLYLGTIDGKDTTETVRRVLRSLMTNSVACRMNYAGRGSKTRIGEMKIRDMITGKCSIFSYVVINGVVRSFVYFRRVSHAGCKYWKFLLYKHMMKCHLVKTFEWQFYGENWLLDSEKSKIADKV